MSALQVLSQAVYVLIFVVVAVDALRRRRRASIDAALFFGDIALLVGLSAARGIFDIALGPVVTWIAVAVVLALPLLLLRLADDYADAPRALLWATAVGFAVVGIAIAAVPPPYPPVLALAIGGYFLVPLVASAVIFSREATRLVGLNRIRMASVAAGTALIVLSIAASAGRSLPSEAAAALATIGALCSLGSALAYVMAFAPPRPLRRLVQGAQLRPFLRAATRLADVRDLQDALRQLERAAAAAIGVVVSRIGILDPEERCIRFTGANEPLAREATDSLLGVVLRTGRPALSVNPARDFPELAAGSRRTQVRAALAARIQIGDEPFGILWAPAHRAALFGDDDLELLTLLADHASIVIENVRLIAEVRRLNEEEQRRGAAAQARLAAIVASSTDAVIGKTIDGIVTDWNPGAERLYGYLADEMVGQSITLLSPPGRTDEIHGLLRQVARGERIESLETVRRRRDGTLVDVSLSLSPIRDRSGAIVGAATIARDISEVRAAARQREQLEGRLRQSERLESIGRLVGGIAHDFNNLLAIVLNYANFIGDRLASDDPNRADLAQIQAAAQRATTFTRQLLTFARRDAIRPEELDLSELLRGVRALLQRSLPESIAIELQVADDVWVALADRGQIEQLLLNLVVNAGDAMPNGGTLLLRTRNERYDEVSAAQHADLAPGPYVELTVTDSGHGMPADVAARAFEPFFTTKPQGKGTGLGLSTVYGIVQQAGGRVSIYSEVNTGTTVRVLLPAVESRTIVAATPAAIEAPARSDATILVVEDEPAVREAARRILEANGYRVVVAPNAAAALHAFSEAQTAIDLLLTDMVMPGMSGPELAARLRAISPALRVAYMTGYSEELVSRNEALDGPLLQKPFTRDPLLRTVAGALGAKI